MKKILGLSLLVTLTVLVGCGGSGTQVSTQAPVTTYTNSATGDADSINVVLSSGAITGFSSVNISNTATGSATQKISDNSVTKFSLSNASGSVSFDKNAGDAIASTTINGMVVVTGQSTTEDALLVSMPNSGFGVYMASANGTSGFGAATYWGKTGSRSSYYPTGTATYQGAAVGLYGVTGFSPVYTAANMTAIANFSTNRILFSTNGTVGISTVTGASLGSYGALDISGKILTDTTGNNLFVGAISDGSGLSGSAEIALFGSSAQEVSGIGSLTNNWNGTPTIVHLISFGGKK